MRVVLDCNVIVSAAWNGGICFSVLRYCLESNGLVVSPAILMEHRRGAEYPKLRRIRSRLEALIDEIEAAAILVDDETLSVVLPDASDVIYLAAAVTGAASVVVTGNLGHFPDRRYGPVRVLSVREFVEAEGIE